MTENSYTDDPLFAGHMEAAQILLQRITPTNQAQALAVVQAHATLAVADVLGYIYADLQDKFLPALREIGDQLDRSPRSSVGQSIADYLGKVSGQ